MAQTDTYNNLVSLIEARMGSSFGTTETTRLKHLINSRIHMIARESDLWENILIIGEERAVNTDTNTIPYTGAVFDATEDLTDINPYTASVDTFLRIHKVNPWKSQSATEYGFQGAVGGARLQGYSSVFGLSKTVDSATATAGTVTIELGASVYVDYYVDGEIQLEGFDTSPADINGTHTVTAVNSASYIAGRTQVSFVVTGASGSWSMAGDETAKTPVAYCTYKKRISGTTYGTDTGETSTIPIEWFEPTAYGVMADMLAADNQFEQSLLWEGRYEKALQLELERLDAQMAAQTIGQQIYTNLSEQGRATSF